MNMHWVSFLSVVGGGALGAGLRWLVVQASTGIGIGTVWAVLVINLLGSLLLGLLVGLGMQRWQVSEEMRAFLQIGLLGGFTTYAAFSLDLWRLIEQHWGLAVMYLLASVIGGVLLVVLGIKLGKVW